MKYNRQRELEEYVSKRDFVSLDELCQMFDKSKNTIRRDVAELVKAGAMEKVYGGVRAVKTPADSLLSFTDRTIKHSEEKEHIGALAAPFVKEGDVIFVDSGTTVLQLIPHIAALSGITVLSNNLHVLTCCMEYPSLNTISFGGQLNPETASFSSNFCSLDNLRRFNINKAFMAATGVSVSKGATNSSPGELPIKRSIVENSDECFLLVDAAKFDHAALLTYAELDQFQYVVTDKAPPAAYLTFFEEHEMQLITG